MNKISILRISIVYLAALAVMLFSGCQSPESPESPASMKIGVLLPLSGPEAMDFKLVLDWAVEELNRNGGIDQRKVELIYRDSHQTDLEELADQLLADPEIKIIIGPNSSSDAFKLIPRFVGSGKLLISPTATSTDLYRAFAGNKTFWRTCQGDVAQLKVILHILKEKGVNRIALLAEDSPYGQTFLDWLGFFSMEMGLKITGTAQFHEGEDDFELPCKLLLKARPEYIIVIANSKDAVNIVWGIKKWKPGTGLIFADAAQTHYLLDKLHDDGEGLEGTAPAIDPASGFEQAYRKRFDALPPHAYAATTYDAFLLSVYALARNQSQGGSEPIHESLKKVTMSDGEKLKWNDVAKGVSLFLKGETPNITGATGSLKFDKKYGVEPLESFYSHWKIKDHDFVIQKRINPREISAGELSEDESIARSCGSMSLARLDEEPTQEPSLPPRKGLKAVVMVGSKGWENYRHQADALAVYQFLKANGTEDKDITLILPDDVSEHPLNSPKGTVKHEVGGKNLREDAVIDYREHGLSRKRLRNILLGKKTAETPIVLDSDQHTDVVLFLAGHGFPERFHFAEGKNLDESDLEKIVRTMHKEKKFRQMLIVLEICFGESLVKDIDLPGVIAFAASASHERCFGCHYDANLKTWLADDFTYKLLHTMKTHPDLSIAECFAKVYSMVNGSHVRLRNYQNFKDFRKVPIIDFFKP